MQRILLYGILTVTVLTSIRMSPPPLRVIFFGDSITEAGVRPGGYITLLKEMLPPEKFDIRGAGIGGNKVYDLYLRLEKDIL
ncbi:MAG TPA: G-D-S-L family lipolytic protein, partial [Bacteroidota bacterium]|nr:G-D-S-L family lipolytic protein [Bacteroidota bacterium]